jgi:hypothetical protein
MVRMGQTTQATQGNCLRHRSIGPALAIMVKDEWQDCRQLQRRCHCHRLDLHLGVDVCCMHQDLSEKGAIVDRLDLKFQSRM